MLRRNGRALFTERLRQIGGVNGISYSGVEHFADRNMGRFSNEKISNKSAIPNGSIHPNASSLAIKAGGMSTYRNPKVELVGSATLIPAAPMSGSSTMTLVGSGAMSKLVPILASGSAVLTGNGSISSIKKMTGNGVLTLTGDGALSAIAHCFASKSVSLLGDGALSATAHMVATNPTVELTAAQISTDILDQQDIESGYSLREALRIMLTALAGKVSGAGTSTITFRNVTDDKNRIVADVDNDGNRTTVTLDVT